MLYTAVGIHTCDQDLVPVNLLFLLLIGLLATPVGEAQAASRPQPPDPEPVVRYLIGYVAESQHTFVRNSVRYSGPEAARHMQRKYEYLRDRIDTVEDFIELAASRSSLSGKAYLVMDGEGAATPSGRWLRAALVEYCARHRTDESDKTRSGHCTE